VGNCSPEESPVPSRKFPTPEHLRPQVAELSRPSPRGLRPSARLQFQPDPARNDHTASGTPIGQWRVAFATVPRHGPTPRRSPRRMPPPCAAPDQTLYSRDPRDEEVAAALAFLGKEGALAKSALTQTERYPGETGLRPIAQSFSKVKGPGSASKPSGCNPAAVLNALRRPSPPAETTSRWRPSPTWTRFTPTLQ